MRTIWILTGALLFLGCDDDPKLEASSTAIEASAEDCLKTVRDRKTKYEETPACNALSALASNYIALDRDDKAPAKYRVRFVSAQRMAWTALAMSESCSGRQLKIW